MILHNKTIFSFCRFAQGSAVSGFRFQVSSGGAEFQVLSVGCCLRESATLRDVERQVLSVASLIAQRLPSPAWAGNCGCDRTAVPICSAWAGIRRDATWGAVPCPCRGLWACLHSLGVVGLTTYDLRITWNVPPIKGRV